MAAILQKILFDAFPWMNSFLILIKISQKYVPKVSTDNNPGLDNGLAPNRRQAIIWTNAGLFHGRIYTSLGLNELRDSMFQQWVKYTKAHPSHKMVINFNWSLIHQSPAKVLQIKDAIEI